MSHPTIEPVVPLRPLRILSVEDEPDTVSGTLKALRSDGNIVREAPNAESAQEPLRAHEFDLVLIDERLPGDAGTTLILQLKRGYFGPRNSRASFIVVTANFDWPTRPTLERLDGYVAVKLKGSSLKPKIRETVNELRKAPPAHGAGRLRRVIGRVDGFRDDGSTVDLLLPSWHSTEPVPVARELLPGARYAPEDRLLGAHYFAWMNLNAESHEHIEITGFEPEEADEDHPGQ